MRGGLVHTPAGPPATAVCVEDGEVRWTGDDDGSAHYVDGADRVVELEGRLVTPAFVDAHAHLAQTGFALGGLDLGAATSLADALNLLAAHARTSTAAVVLGFGWDETAWPEQRPFTRHEVDAATGGRAAMLSRVDVHSAVVSTAFLDACPDVVHAEGYEATGRVARAAHHAAREGLFRLIPAADRADAITRALADAAAQGLGMVHEIGAPHISPPADFDVIDELVDAVAGDAPVHPEVVRYWGSLDVAQAEAIGCTGAAGDLCVDGSIGSRTTALHAPYADADSTGHLYLDADTIAAHVVDCTRRGLQAGFHVIGDRAVSEVVAGFDAAAEVVGTAALVQARHRLEHVEMVAPEQMDALGRYGVTASMQPLFDAWWGGPDSLYAQRLGPERARPMNAFASLSRAGVALAFGSDTPVTPFAPWAAVRAAVWHHTETERIPTHVAFEAHTRGGWRAARLDDGGVVAPGAPANLAVWDLPGGARTGVPPLPDLHPDLDLPVCAMTMVRGRVAHELEGAF
jgi:predicted amidohydrolase YtcJ